MPVFKMARSYEPTVILKTEDLLSAIKTTCNYEGDLYVDGRLVLSCLGLSRGDNTLKLLEYGITSYVNKRSNCWNHKYTDESKNKRTFFTHGYHYMWDGTPRVEFRIKEYREFSRDKEFKSLSAVMEYIRQEVASKNIPYDLNEDIHVSLYGEDGLLSFAPGDWQSETEPEMSVLTKEGHKPEFGPYHYLLKRYLVLSAKYEGYSLSPAPVESKEGFQEGQVVCLCGGDDRVLYLIDSVNYTTDNTPIYKIRDLDDYEITADLFTKDIMYPKVSVRQ